MKILHLRAPTLYFLFKSTVIVTILSGCNAVLGIDEGILGDDESTEVEPSSGGESGDGGGDATGGSDGNGGTVGAGGSDISSDGGSSSGGASVGGGLIGDGDSDGGETGSGGESTSGGGFFSGGGTGAGGRPMNSTGGASQRECAEAWKSQVYPCDDVETVSLNGKEYECCYYSTAQQSPANDSANSCDVGKPWAEIGSCP